MPHHDPHAHALRTAIDRIVGRVDPVRLARAARGLSDAYRGSPDRPRADAVMADDAARVAYLVTRFPGTLAALESVAGQADARLSFADARTLLELGAGPGPSLWALAPRMPRLERAVLVDGDHRMLAVARELADSAPVPPGTAVEFHAEPIDRGAATSRTADVVVVSYALGELAEPDRARTVDRAWSAAGHALVLVEPGTSAGFERIRAARASLIACGARIVAPCPHAGACPMAAPDWCHFGARTERTRLHRQLKGGSLGYEDEKYSYLVATRHDVPHGAPARIIARPRPHSGFVNLRVCTVEAVRDLTVSRRRGSAYRAARHAQWGDEWGERGDGSPEPHEP